jgi:hypothetical protein
MKLSVMSTAMLMLFGLAAMAQGGPEARQEKKEEIEARKRSFINKELQLNDAEAKALWVVADQHSASKKAKADAIKGKGERTLGKNLNELTDEQIAKNMSQLFEMKKAMLELEMEYHEKYVGAIGVRKTAEYYRAEEKFKRELLKRMREKRGAAKAGNRAPTR